MTTSQTRECSKCAAPASASSEGGSHVLEQRRRLSDSLLWRAQRAYFERVGVSAWSTGTVPHYVITNPALANALARVVFAFFRDSGVPSDKEPFTIIELGAGSGRFGYLFLKALLEIRACSPLPQLPFRYVLTDFVEANVAFCEQHPSFQPFVTSGVLDFARFDLERDETLTLRVAGETLRPGSLSTPLVALANYVFDGVPQDSFTFSGGQVLENLVTVTADDPDIDLASDGIFAKLGVQYSSEPATADYYAEPAFNAILHDYACALDGASVLFPVAALRCMHRLAALSGGRLMLLTGDKGFAHRQELESPDSAAIAVHGSFSTSVNYHAFCQWFEAHGGQALRTRHRQLSLQILACLLGEPEGGAMETRLAFHLAFDVGGTDDVFRLRHGIQAHYAQLEHAHLLSLLRLTCHDPRVLGDCLPALLRQAHGLAGWQKRDLAQAVERTWANYFHIGEERDLAFGFATLLAACEAHEAAIELFGASLRLHGEDPRAHWNIAACLVALGRDEEAVRALARAREVAPGYPITLELRATSALEH